MATPRDVNVLVAPVRPAQPTRQLSQRLRQVTAFFSGRGSARVMASEHWPGPAKPVASPQREGCVRLKTIGRFLSLLATLLCLGVIDAGPATLDSSVAVTDPATLQALERDGL